MNSLINTLCAVFVVYSLESFHLVLFRGKCLTKVSRKRLNLAADRMEKKEANKQTKPMLLSFLVTLTLGHVPQIDFVKFG